MLKENMQTKENNTTEKRQINWVREILSWILVIGGGFVLAWFVTRVVIVKAAVPTNSMETTIMVGDKIIGNRLAYLFTSPERGDIVIFEYPDNPEEDYVKRVIGLPGETITFADGNVYIDGDLLEEDYTNGMETYPEDQETFTVPEGCYFMMGDNRIYSSDSRYWDNPFVSEDAIKGKVWIRYSPSWGKIE